MRSRVMLAAAAMVVAATVATPGVVGAQLPAEDSVTGTVLVIPVLPIPTTIVFDAHSGPSGEDPHGTVTVTGQGELPLIDAVRCLNVQDNAATIGYERDGVFLLRVVHDLGVGSQDRVGITPNLNPPACPDPESLVVANPLGIISGDIVVHDAPPAPTTTAQCRNGGWRSLVDDQGQPFKNQGQCVRFVVQTLARR
jgi:hypothetical protein